jgi:hypothetical protein
LYGLALFGLISAFISAFFLHIPNPAASARASAAIADRAALDAKAHHAAGQLAHDNKNPDPAFRQRLLCGLTILQGLQPAGS